MADYAATVMDDVSPGSPDPAGAPDAPGAAGRADATGSPPVPPCPQPGGPRPRHRDRHGRGMRGPVAPPQVPLSASRAQVFDDFVRDAVERLERHVPQIADIDFVVQEVPRPQGPADDWQDEAVPLGAAVEARKGRPAQVVVYRRPVEIRAKGRDERALLVHEVVVEQVADVLGLTPEAVDPRYGEGE
ncbi:metallopeptidase family protein [Actinomadura keratinilytica]